MAQAFLREQNGEVVHGSGVPAGTERRSRNRVRAYISVERGEKVFWQGLSSLARIRRFNSAKSLRLDKVHFPPCWCVVHLKNPGERDALSRDDTVSSPHSRVTAL